MSEIGHAPLSTNALTVHRRSLLPVVYFGGLGALLTAIVLGLHKSVLPAGPASNLGNNSEAVLFALVVGAWIQFALPRCAMARRRAMWATVCLGVVWFLVGVGLAASSLPTRVKTLQEPAFAIAFTTPYLTLARPLRRWVPALLSLAIVATIVVGVAAGRPPAGEALGFSNWVIDQAETLVLLLLVPIAFDVVDVAILDRTRVTSARLRLGFYAVMLAIPVGIAAVGWSARVGDGLVPLTLNYLGRAHESFIGILLVTLYFAVGLGRTGPDLASPAAGDADVSSTEPTLDAR